jgi:ABC-2 type transport system permease protein
VSAGRDVFVIARRELLERIQSKWFLVMTVVMPLAMVAMIVVLALLTARGEGAKIEILDRTGVLAQPLADSLAALEWKPAVIAADTPEAVEMARIRTKQITGFLTIPADGLDGGTIVYRGENGSSQVVELTLREVVGQAVQDARGKRVGLSDAARAALFRRLEFDSLQTSGTGEATQGSAAFFVGYAIAYLLLLVIITYGVAVMRSVVQEKTSRVMELMVATVKPSSLMSGKILGVGTAGLIQIAIWLTMGALTLAYREQILGVFGRSGGGGGLPSIAADHILIALGYFILGYFFYAALYASLGAMVSTDQEAQQVQTPVTVLLVAGIAMVTAVSGDPRGVTSAIVTMLPFWSALLMPMRYFLGGATLGEVAISLAILALSTVLVARAAAKIYRVGVLMYGKRPSVRELIRWMRY